MLHWDEISVTLKFCLFGSHILFIVIVITVMIIVIVVVVFIISSKAQLCQIAFIYFTVLNCCFVLL